MGKPTGFMEYQRKTGNTVAPLERIKNFKEFHSAFMGTDPFYPII
jgi:glutamate synthase (NADPH/NADH) small chain